MIIAQSIMRSKPATNRAKAAGYFLGLQFEGATVTGIDSPKGKEQGSERSGSSPFNARHLPELTRVDHRGPACHLPVNNPHYQEKRTPGNGLWVQDSRCGPRCRNVRHRSEVHCSGPRILVAQSKLLPLTSRLIMSILRLQTVSIFSRLDRSWLGRYPCWCPPARCIGPTPPRHTSLVHAIRHATPV
jgi:hypothetical protein